MKIKTHKIECIKIQDIEGLDDITVYTEDPQPRHGKITIECYGRSWSNYWNGMGDRCIKAFFSQCGADYLANKLSPRTDRRITDYDEMDVHLKKDLIELRRKYHIDANEARYLWDKIDDHCQNDEGFIHDSNCTALAQSIWGDEWWHELPEVDNHEYTYLCRIIRTVQDAFKEIIGNTSSPQGSDGK